LDDLGIEGAFGLAFIEDGFGVALVGEALNGQDDGCGWVGS